MFRVNYRPIACPLRGPFSFSYSRGHMLQQECHQPDSRLERCIHGYRMLFRYQACVDVMASAEETGEPGGGERQDGDAEGIVRSVMQQRG